jgi:hypothetical protein
MLPTGWGPDHGEDSDMCADLHVGGAGVGVGTVRTGDGALESSLSSGSSSLSLSVVGG